jgi:hypothetical protein
MGVRSSGPPIQHRHLKLQPVQFLLSSAPAFLE